MKIFYTSGLSALLLLFYCSASFAYPNFNKSFVENVGQVTDQNRNQRPDIIAKYAAGNDLNIFLSNTGIHYQWSKGNEMYRMDVRLLGANPYPKISKENQTKFREQYHHATVNGTAHSFKKIIYHDIYPGIDWVFYFNGEGKLEHDFVIRAGGKVSDIKLQYLGTERLKIDRYGNLIANTPYGRITEPAPYSYEQETGRKISSSYVVNGNMLTFKADAYNGTLVIDPVIDWATYFGGSEYDEIRDLKIGKDGFVYAVGATNSTTNIATVGAYLVTFQGGSNSIGSDAFITKFDTDGNCIWSTYYGGTNVDLGLSLAVDTAGYLYMGGRTNSQTGIATAGSHQESKAGNVSGYDAFIAKFDTSGSVVWATYYGGNFNEGSTGLAVTSDRFDNIYIAGNTNSSTGISTPGAFQLTRPGSEEGFIAKFNTSGILSWATYYGSGSNDYINSIVTDTPGDIIVVGHTQSTSGLSTTGAFLETGNGATDGFIAKFDSTGQRVWGTYFGGNGYDKLDRLVTDSSNAIYCIGLTESTNAIATSNAYQMTAGGMQDFCLAKFNASGAIEWGTYFGGVDNETAPALTYSDGKLYLTGETGSPDNITTPDAISPIYNGSFSETLLAVFNTSGQRTWATYLGGDVTDRGTALAVNDMEQVFLVGKTSSVNNLATAGAHQTTFGGNEDGLLMRINMCDVPVTPTAIAGNIEVCENSEQQYTVSAVAGADSYEWILPNGWTGTSSTDTINVIVGADGGEIKAVAMNTCGASDTISLAVTVNPAPQATISRNGNALSVAQTFTSYQWILDGTPITGATNPTHIATGNGTYTLEVWGANGCSSLSNEIIVDDITSISEGLEKLGVKLYPNPFSTELYIYSPIDVQGILIDVLGRPVKADLSIKEKTKLDLSSLPAGNYYLNVYSPVTNEYLGTANVVKVAN